MKFTAFLFTLLTAMAAPTFAAHHEGDHGAMKAEGTRAMVVAIVGEIVAIDNETKEELGTVTKQVNYSILYMKAVKALQEAMDRIETLEAKVAALES